MELIHALDFPVDYLTGSTGDREMVCAVGVKVTYALDQGWLVPVGNDESWPVFREPMVVEGVQFPPELDYRKRNIDIVVLGKAHAPGGKPTRHMGVLVRSGKINYQIGVVGDRIWTGSLTGIIQTDPKPFVEMPLTNDRAYGGKALFDGLEVLHPLNPQGKGYYLAKTEAKGQPLPNLERPGQLITAWSDQPKPACLLPFQGGMDLEEKFELDEQGMPRRMSDRFFNFAAPELVVTRDQLGNTISLLGMHPSGQLTYPLPPYEGPQVKVTVGDHRSTFPLCLSTLVVLPENEAMVVGYLAVFRYLFAPRETRQMELTWDADYKVRPVEQD